MKKLKIALCDVRHRTMGLHSYQMPLGIGLIASYAMQKLEDRVEVRLYKYSDPFWKDFESWRPDVVGASFFSWNRRLTLFLLEKARQKRPEIFTLLGGPELELEEDKRATFLRQNRAVGVCCVEEGEATALEIFRLLLDGKDPRKQESLDGTFFLHPEHDGLIVNPLRARIPSLDEIPSPYTSGLFDQFFDDHLHPFIESHRGCPFSCKYCHMGLSQNTQVTFQSVARTMQDLEYCAKRYAGRSDIQLCIGDNNFAMYEKDIEFADRIRDLQEKYGWPRYMVTSTGKNNKDRIVAVSNRLKWGLPFNMAAQSLHPETLEVIGRKNISLDSMRETLKSVNNAEADSYTEIIMNLPMETRHTFEEGLREIVKTNLNWISILTLRLLNGTWLTYEETMQRYQFDVRYRVICRQLGDYDGKRIIEIEAVVVGTDTMPYQDYCDLRELAYIIQVIYNSDTFNPIRRFLLELGIDVWEWIKVAHEMVKDSDSEAKVQLEAFMDETRNELFDSEDQLIEYFAEEANYQKLLSGEIGDNLIAKYSVLAGSEGFNDWLDIAVKAAKKIIAERIPAQKREEVMETIKKFIRVNYNFAPYFYEPPLPDEHKHLDMSFDIKKWMLHKDLSVDGCWGPFVYDCYFSAEKVKRINMLKESSHDLSFTIQRVYRDKNFEELMPEFEIHSEGQALYNRARGQ